MAICAAHKRRCRTVAKNVLNVTKCNEWCLSTISSWEPTYVHTKAQTSEYKATAFTASPSGWAWPPDPNGLKFSRRRQLHIDFCNCFRITVRDCVLQRYQWCLTLNMSAWSKFIGSLRVNRSARTYFSAGLLRWRYQQLALFWHTVYRKNVFSADENDCLQSTHDVPAIFPCDCIWIPEYEVRYFDETSSVLQSKWNLYCELSHPIPALSGRNQFCMTLVRAFGSHAAMLPFH